MALQGEVTPHASLTEHTDAQASNSSYGSSLITKSVGSKSRSASDDDALSERSGTENQSRRMRLLLRRKQGSGASLSRKRLRKLQEMKDKEKEAILMAARLDSRLEIINLFMRKTLTDDTFLGRKELNPWAFRHNQSLHSKWDFVHNMVTTQEMLVVINNAKKRYATAKADRAAEEAPLTEHPTEEEDVEALNDPEQENTETAESSDKDEHVLPKDDKDILKENIDDEKEEEGTSDAPQPEIVPAAAIFPSPPPQEFPKSRFHAPARVKATRMNKPLGTNRRIPDGQKHMYAFGSTHARDRCQFCLGGAMIWTDPLNGKEKAPQPPSFNGMDDRIQDISVIYQSERDSKDSLHSKSRDSLSLQSNSNVSFSKLKQLQSSSRTSFSKRKNLSYNFKDSKAKGSMNKRKQFASKKQEFMCTDNTDIIVSMNCIRDSKRGPRNTVGDARSRVNNVNHSVNKANVLQTNAKYADVLHSNVKSHVVHENVKVVHIDEIKHSVCDNKRAVNNTKDSKEIDKDMKYSKRNSKRLENHVTVSESDVRESVNITNELMKATKEPGSKANGLQISMENSPGKVDRLKKDMEKNLHETKVLASEEKGFKSEKKLPVSKASALHSDTEVSMSKAEAMNSNTKAPVSKAKYLQSDTEVTVSKAKDLQSDTKVTLSKEKDLQSDTKVTVSKRNGFHRELKVPVNKTNGLLSDAKLSVSNANGLRGDTKVPVSKTNGFHHEIKDHRSKANDSNADTKANGFIMDKKLSPSLQSKYYMSKANGFNGDMKDPIRKGEGAYANETESVSTTVGKKMKERIPQVEALMKERVTKFKSVPPYNQTIASKVVNR